MKKYLILMLAAAAALVSCGKETLAPETDVPENINETVQATPITFNLSANHPDATKAVKRDWEDGDAIFVFFDNVAAPKHLKMTFDEAFLTWNSSEYDGAAITPGALGLKNGDNGTMRAVFLPFGSDATVSASGTSFTFSETYYAYYLTATLDYTVADNKVSGAFNMVIPDGYVQFFVEDAEATDEGYLLGTDAVIPVGVASIAANGDIIETSDKTYVDDMPGYVYDNGTDQKGYIFTGKLNGSYAYSGSYYFSKTKSDGTVRHDYFVSGKTIASHSAVKLPAASNIIHFSYGSYAGGKWLPVGANITAKLQQSYDEGMTVTEVGTWFTCNYNQSVPESIGDNYTFDAANGLGVTLPSQTEFETLIGKCTWTWLTVHGHAGYVVKCYSGFLFLPAQRSTGGEYWSSTPRDERSAYYLPIESEGGHGVFGNDRTYEYAVRPFQN